MIVYVLSKHKEECRKRYIPNTDHRTVGEYRRENLVERKEDTEGRKNCWMFLSTSLLPVILQNVCVAFIV